MKTNRRRKDLFGKMKKGTLIALLCVGGITASAQTIGGNVYGGGNAAEVSGNTAVVVVKGDIAENVFGGGCRANVTGYADVWIQGGTITKSVYGGNDITGTVVGTGTAPTERNGVTTSAPTTASFVLVTGTPTITENVFGGGNGEYDYTTSTKPYYGLTAPAIAATTVKISAEQTDPVSHINNVFGGGNAAPVNDSTTVDIVSGNIDNVYGGGNKGSVGISESNPGNTDVNVTGGLISGSVYGGGCQADVWGYADVLINSESCNIGNVYGGNDITGTVKGNGTAPTTRNEVGTTSEPATDNASYVRVANKPTHITNVFGGGNGDYDYTTSTSDYYGLTAPTMAGSYVEIDMNAGGDIDNVYGGGNKAEVGDAEVYIKNQGHIDYVFGGGNAATVTNSTLVDISAIINVEVFNATTVFGGNNQAQMNILPTINLTSGLVETVYGGGNAGAMYGSGTKTDVFGNDVENLSTYIYAESTNIKISNAIYGGCKDAEVKYNTFVDIRNTHIDGIPNVFGGNDHGGTVGNTRVDAVNGTIINLYGASNGDYFLNDDGTRKTDYVFPNCGSTNVNIYGGTFTNIYGGGYAGNVTGNTYMLLDDQIEGTATASISGKLFGGGYGYEPYALSKTDTNVGNVYGTAITDAKHITTLTNAKLYGGGNAGDVDSTLLTLYSTWDVKLSEIYGGCRASNVRGTAHTILKPSQSESVETSHVVFGGNDFAGTTNNSILDIYSGHYNRVYGAGNGDYDYTTYFTSNPSTDPKIKQAIEDIDSANRKFIPVSGDVNTNFYGGIIDSNLYGCSEMGYVYKEIHDTNYNAATANADISKYSTIITNIHGGLIKNDVFGGAHGRLGNEQLVFGIKIINMDGGTINYSLHGGSESVNDGYPNECSTPSATTQRPSSVINITGGTVRNRTFGGGYMGQIYGSVYVNVGKWAVDSCEAWTKKYAGASSASYASLKPEFVGNNPVAAQLMVNDLALEKSIYSGADWGTSGEDDASSLYYNKPCFHGGKSELSIDGRDYNSTNDVGALPFITLNESLYGSGTSSEGGDIIRIIKLKNYGEAYGCENTYRSLKSIQRADSLTIQNVNLELIGAPSNVALYSTPNYTISRIDKEVRFIDKNYFKMDAPVNQIGNLTFYKHTSATDIALVTSNELEDYTEAPEAEETCDDLSVCAWRGTSVENHPKYTTLYMMQGNYIEVRQWVDDNENSGAGDNIIDDDAPYGAVLGYAYFATESDYMATIIARPQQSSAPFDGGFMSNCKGNNNFGATGSEETEMAYDTPTPGYRVWNLKNGTGNRRRNVNIVAHNDPSMMPGIDQSVTNTYGTNTPDLATAIAELAMPPSTAGNYFRIDQIIIDNENRTLSLANAGMYYEYNTTTEPDWATDGSVEQNSTATDADAKRTEAINNGVDFIEINSQNRFGLTMQGWDNFSAHNAMVISGNTWGSGISRTTPSISGADNVIPTSRLTLTYDTTFTANTQRTVTLMMTELTSGNIEVAPLEVVITIETLTKKLGDNNLTLLAMFNDGNSNEYEKKVLIPATQKDYDFYLNKIEWKYATDASGSYDDDFFLRPNAEVNNTNYDEKTFSLKFQLSEDISSTVKEDNAWRSLTTALTNRTGDFCELSSISTSANEGIKSFETTGNDLGLLIGELDSRFTAAINVILTFNGNEVFPKNAIIGNATLKFKAKNKMKNETPDEFTINIDVLTRPKGDTIYIASAPFVTRDEITLYPWNYNPGSGHTESTVIPNPTPSEKSGEVSLPGRMPDRYVQSIDEALTESITGFTEGDVLCIIDTLNIKSNYICRGTDYNVIQVVRYDGSHFIFPGEACAYRGPMIHISNGANFTAWNMRFDGKGLSRICVADDGSTSTTGEKQYGSTELSGNPAQQGSLDDRINSLNKNATATYFQRTSSSDKYFHKKPQDYDTTISFGPIFMVTGANSSLTLNNRTYVVNNFNLATDKESHNKSKVDGTTDTAGYQYYGGAIVVRGTTKPRLVTTSPDNPLFADAPMVELVNNVEISGNLVMNPKSGSPATWTAAPRGAGIEVENGIVLLSTHKDATIDITKNYYAPTNGTDFATGVLSQDDSTQKWSINESYFTTTEGAKLKNNIHLTRTVGTVTSTSPLDLNDKVFNDDINDIVYMRSEMSPTTKIGINKWFPAIAPYYRDTIQFAMAVSSQTRAEKAFNTNNFPSDSSFEQIYHISINPYLVYYKRCNGFRLQDSLDLTHFPEDLAAIRFDYEPDAASTPTYDKLSVRVKGGLFPRTYTWYQVNSDNTMTQLQKDTSAYSNTQIKKDPTGAYRRESNTDSYRLANMTTIDPLYPKATYKYQVKANDLLGCELKKDVQVFIAKAEATGSDYEITTPFDASAPVPGVWIDKTITSANSVYVTDTLAAHQVNILRTLAGVKVKVGILPEETAGSVTAKIEGIADPLTKTQINDGIFTTGDVLTLTATPTDPSKQFMFWDYDPYAPATTDYIVPSKSTEVNAQFAPNDYWYQNVTSRPAGYTTDYNGNVHISSVEGLAWLISVVNGLNGQQSRPMYFDTVFIDPSVTYDMSAHLWTPVGTDYQKFMGTVMADTGSTGSINISKIIVNEPNVNNVGMFGVLDGAKLDNIKLTDATVRGLQYVGTLAAKAENRTLIQNCDVAGVAITTYASGGIAGSTQDSKIDKSNSNVTYRGSAIYNGGVAGISNLSDSITNNKAVSTSWLKNAIHQGGLSGTLGGKLLGPNDNNNNSDNNDPTPSNHAYIANNFAVMNFGDEANVSILGGIAGKAENVVMENNYVYGDSQHGTTTGAIIGDMGDNVTVNNCFYETGMATSAIGNIAGENQSTRNITSFNGEGNRVTVSENVGGINNLTRILNNWVRQQPEPNYNTWRSDLENVNNGYPIFGTPDIIPVYDTIEYTTCDYYDWNGEAFYESGQYSRNFIVEDQFIDSTVTLMLTINSSMLSEFADSVQLGIDYYGHGFSFTATEQELIRRTVAKEGFATIEFNDTLQTAHGCDSIVTLTLTVYDGLVSGTETPEAVTVKVYPNPTTSIVNVEATGLKEVEVYDNASRRIADSKVDSDHCIINLNNNASGSYYLRIYTEKGVAIRKVIKK